MYKLALLVSTVSTTNLFRSAVLGAFGASHHTNFLICSGFFHERTNGKGPFYASKAFAGARTMFPIGSSITTVGAYNPGCVEYVDFVNSLRGTLKNSSGGPLRVRARYAQQKWKNKWHAKIFIAAEKRVPRFAVIGSSNLTRAAFGPAPVNNESDVIIWDDSHAPTRAVANAALTELGDLTPRAQSPHIIVASYDQTDPRNTTVAPMDLRLVKLWRDVAAATR